MNEKFIVLSFVASIIKWTGWLLVAAGAAYAFYNGVVEPSQPGHYFNWSTNGFHIALGIGAMITGLFKIAIGELIGVLFAIEKNTRKI